MQEASAKVARLSNVIDLDSARWVNLVITVREDFKGPMLRV
jgi:hypothetical protein